MQSDEECPFKPGDIVTYQPSVRGYGLTVMSDLAALEAGAKYTIARIEKDYYVVLEGF